MQTTLPFLVLLSACSPVGAFHDFLAARPPDRPPSVPAALSAPPAKDLTAAPALTLPMAPASTATQATPVSAPTPATTSATAAAPALGVTVSPTSAPILQAPEAPSNPPAEKAKTTKKSPIHRLRRGETLTAVAAAHHIPLRELLVANDYTLDDKPLAGARITLTAVDDGRWVVRKRQTLSQIARTLGVGTANLARANGLADADEIFVGQVLVLPTSQWTESR